MWFTSISAITLIVCKKQIAEDAGIKKQNVSRNIKILVARGYVVGNNNVGFRITRMLDDLDDQ